MVGRPARKSGRMGWFVDREGFMTYVQSASSVFGVLLVTGGAWGQVQSVPVKPRVAETATVAATPAVMVNGRKVVAAVSGLTREKQQDASTVLVLAKAALGPGTDTDSLFQVMLEYQSMMNKEHLEDARMTEQDQALLTRIREAKLAMENAAIDAGMREAREKALNLMEAATLQLVTGIIGGMVQLAGGAMANATDSYRASDAALGAVAEQALTQRLPVTARAAVERQVEAMLARVTKAWDAK